MENQIKTTACPENNMHGRNPDKPESEETLLHESDSIRFFITPDTLKKVPLTHEFMYILEYDLFSIAKEKNKSPVKIVENLLSTGIIVDAAIEPPGYDLSADLPSGSFWYVVLYSTILDPEFMDEAADIANEHIFQVDRDELVDIDIIQFNLISKKVELLASDIYPESQDDNMADQKIMPKLSEDSDDPGDKIINKSFAPAFLDPIIQNQDTDGHPDSSFFPGFYPDMLYQNKNDIRVGIEKLDQMINLVGELVIAESMLTKACDTKEANKQDFHRCAHHLRRIVSELQNLIMSVRMIPLMRTFKNMVRFIHNLSRQFNKNVKVRLIGEDTEVDKTVIEYITGPITELIKNSVEHGIEYPHERKAFGKPSFATIVLEAKHEDGEILIRISDDGRGLDRGKIIAKAIEQGIAARDTTIFSDEEINILVFESGFTTADSGNNNSSRGMGMDVVKKNMAKLKGRVAIESSPDKGTTVTLRFPITMAIIEGMLVRVGKSYYTIPILSILESLRPSKDQITVTMGGQELVKIRDELIPVIRLHKLYGIVPDHKELDKGILINILSGSKKVCLFADELIRHHQTVIKGLPEYIGLSDGISGCNILDDGSVGLIIDVSGLINIMEKKE